MQSPIEAESLRKRRWAVVLPSMWVPFIVSFLYSVFLDGTLAGNAAYVSVKFFLLLFPIIITIWVLKERVLASLPDIPRQRMRSIVMGSVFGIATVALMFGLLKTGIGDVVRESNGPIRKFVSGLGVLDNFWIFAIFLSCIHSYMEEFFWRWFVFGNLRKLIPVGGAILLAGIGFASHHVVILSKFLPLPWAVLFGAFVGLGGIVWSWFYYKHNTLWGAWISHMIIDFGIMWIGWELIQS